MVYYFIDTLDVYQGFPEIEEVVVPSDKLFVCPSQLESALHARILQGIIRAREI